MIWTSLIAQSRRSLWMSLFLAVLVALVYFHFARFYQGSASSWLFTIGWVPVGLNLVRAGLGLVYHLDRHPFRRLDLGLESDEAPPAGAFEIEIQMEARREATLRKLSVELRAVRRAVTEKGRERTVLSSEERVLEEDLPLSPGLTKSYQLTLPVPKDAPFSYRSMEGKIAWALHVTVAVEGWGELEDELPLTVAPV